jgi:hypothetical protein
MLSVNMSRVPAAAVPSVAKQKLGVGIVVVLLSPQERGASSSNAVHDPMIKTRRNEMLDGQLCRIWSFLGEIPCLRPDRLDLHYETRPPSSESRKSASKIGNSGAAGERDH